MSIPALKGCLKSPSPLPSVGLEPIIKSTSKKVTEVNTGLMSKINAQKSYSICTFPQRGPALRFPFFYSFSA